MRSRRRGHRRSVGVGRSWVRQRDDDGSRSTSGRRSEGRFRRVDARMPRHSRGQATGIPPNLGTRTSTVCERPVGRPRKSTRAAVARAAAGGIAMARMRDDRRSQRREESSRLGGTTKTKDKQG
ncbi:hypothetical protein VTK73DRAFT_5059 [Phialemonium thermophilum]|uniref:Uncharacterized protein n=1 Tax=Phialemonium thermophilum TaxID=223376 RepID=A0ABR3V4V7_9PEZI